MSLGHCTGCGTEAETKLCMSCGAALCGTCVRGVPCAHCCARVCPLCLEECVRCLRMVCPHEQTGDCTQPPRPSRIYPGYAYKPAALPPARPLRR